MTQYISFFTEHEHYERKFDEALQWKYVVRDGKRVRKPFSSKDGYKITRVNGKPKEVKMGGTERTKLSKQNTKSHKKAKAHQTQTNHKRAKSMAKHSWS
jgi:hypothetical protein